MNLIRKTKNKWPSLSKIHFLGILVAALSVIGCQCNGGNDEKNADLSLKMKVEDQYKAISGTKSALIVVEHSGKEGDADVKLSEYELRASIVKQLLSDNKDGSGSELKYNDENKVEKLETSINRLVSLFEDTTTLLQPGKTKTISIGVKPGANVTTVEFVVQLFKKGDTSAEDKPCGDAVTITWTLGGIPPKPVISLAIKDLNNFTGNDTKFKLKNEGQVEVELTDDVEIKVMPTSFGLLKTNNTVANSGKIGEFISTKLGKNQTVELTLKVDMSAASDKEEVIVTVTPKGGAAVTAKAEWTKPALVVNWDGSVNPFVASQVTTFTVATNNNDFDSDEISVFIEGSSKGNFELVAADGTSAVADGSSLTTLLTSKTIIKKGSPAVSAKLRAKGLDKLTGDQNIDVVLKKGTVKVGSGSIRWSKEKVEIVYTGFFAGSSITTFKLRPVNVAIPSVDFTKITLKLSDPDFKFVTNATTPKEESEASLDNLLSDKTNIAINTPSTGNITLKLVAKAPIKDKSRDIKIEVKRGAEVIGEGTITWKSEDIRMVFAGVDNEFEFKKGTPIANLNGRILAKNDGVSTAKIGKLKLVVTRTKGTNAEFGSKASGTITSFSNNSFDVAGDVAGGATAPVFEFKLDPKNDTEVEYKVNFEYDSNILKDSTGKEIAKIISWKKIDHTKLDLAVTKSDMVGDLAADKDFTFIVTNGVGGDPIKQDNLSLKIDLNGITGSDFSVAIGATTKDMGLTKGVSDVIFSATELGLTTGTDFAASATFNLKLTLDSKVEKEVELVAQLLYEDETGTKVPVGSAVPVSWKCAAKVDAKITNWKVIDSKTATADFVLKTAAGREISKKEIEDFLVLPKVTGTGSLVSIVETKTNKDLSTNSLTDLGVIASMGALSSVIADGTDIVIPVKLTRADNKALTINGLELALSGVNIPNAKAFIPQPWNSLPTITLTADKTVLIATDATVTVTAKSSEDLDIAKIAKGKLSVILISTGDVASKGAKLEVTKKKVGKVDINTLPGLTEQFKLKKKGKLVAATGATLDLEFSGIKRGDTAEFEITIIGLEDVVVVNPILIKKTA
jgi:hypothetical protein